MRAQENFLLLCRNKTRLPLSYIVECSRVMQKLVLNQVKRFNRGTLLSRKKINHLWNIIHFYPHQYLEISHFSLTKYFWILKKYIQDMFPLKGKKLIKIMSDEVLNCQKLREKQKVTDLLQKKPWKCLWVKVVEEFLNLKKFQKNFPDLLSPTRY